MAKKRRFEKEESIRFTTLLPESMFNKLSEISIQEDLTLSQIIRRALELYLISQQEILSTDYSPRVNYLSETRTKKAVLLNQANQINKIPEVAKKEPTLVLKGLNPEAY